MTRRYAYPHSPHTPAAPILQTTETSRVCSTVHCMLLKLCFNPWSRKVTTFSRLNLDWDWVEAPSSRCWAAVVTESVDSVVSVCDRGRVFVWRVTGHHLVSRVTQRPQDEWDNHSCVTQWHKTDFPPRSIPLLFTHQPIKIFGGETKNIYRRKNIFSLDYKNVFLNNTETWYT